MALILLLAATMAELLGHSVSDTNHWMHVGLGFNIKSVVADRFGLWVSYETDQQPPYFVGVYDPAHLGLSRDYPLEYVITDSTNAYLRTRDFLKCNVFVQVGTVQGMIGNRKAEKVALSRMKDGPPEPGSEDLDWSNSKSLFENKEGKLNRIPLEMTMQHVDTCTWAAFLYGDLTGHLVRTLPHEPRDWYWDKQVTWTIYEISEITTEDTSTTPPTITVNSSVETLLSTNSTLCWRNGQSSTRRERLRKISDTVSVYSNWTWLCRNPVTNRWARYNVVNREEPWMRVPALNTSIGTGYRVVTFEDHEKSTIHRAWSTRPDRSDEFLVHKPVKAVSVWDERSIKFDWLGRPYYSNNTNAVPGRLYMNGVPW